MIAGTQSHIFRWRSRFRRRRVCLSSLMKHWMRLKPNYGNTGVTDTNLVPRVSLLPWERKKRVPGNEIRQTLFSRLSVIRLQFITIYGNKGGKTLHLLIPCHVDFIRRTFVFSQFKPTGATRQLTDRFLSMPVFDQVFDLRIFPKHKFHAFLKRNLLALCSNSFDSSVKPRNGFCHFFAVNVKQ